MTNPEDKYAPTVWPTGDSKPEAEGEDLTLSSGQVIRVRKLAVEDMIEHGILELFDIFSKMLAQDPKPEEEQSDTASVFAMFKDPETSKRLMDSMNKVVPIVCISPKVMPPRAKGRPANKASIYVNNVPLTDRMEIFAYALSGVAGMSRFRQE